MRRGERCTDGPIKTLHYVAGWGEANDVRLSFVPTHSGNVHLRDGDDRFGSIGAACLLPSALLVGSGPP